MRTPSPSTNQVSASYHSPPNTAIVSTVVQKAEPRTPQLKTFISITVTSFGLNQKGRESKSPRTVSTTNRSKLLSIQPVAAHRIKRITVNRQIVKHVVRRECKMCTRFLPVDQYAASQFTSDKSRKTP